eukprot:6001183-Amphidinium_carterae.1
MPKPSVDNPTVCVRACVRVCVCVCVWVRNWLAVQRNLLSAQQLESEEAMGLGADHLQDILANTARTRKSVAKRSVKSSTAKPKVLCTRMCSLATSMEPAFCRTEQNTQLWVRLAARGTPLQGRTTKPEYP